MPELEIECAECGKALEANFESRGFGPGVFLSVAPCEKCMEKADEAGWERGREEHA